METRMRAVIDDVESVFPSGEAAAATAGRLAADRSDAASAVFGTSIDAAHLPPNLVGELRAQTLRVDELLRHYWGYSSRWLR